MPRCTRVVLLSPAGSTTGNGVVEKDDNWILNRMMILGGKRVGAAGDDMEKAKSCEEAVEEAKRGGRIEEGIVVHRGILRGGGGGDGLGDLYYKVCGSEPEEIVERTFDNARKGVKILLGDSIDVSLKKKEKGDSDSVRAMNLKEEMKNKTSRLTLAKVIVQSLFVEEPEERYSVLADFSEEISTDEECREKIEGLKQHA
ncbi:hypothetical protein TrST_g7216 [Triparma strigata]|uniref:Uncharacterized protein n=1 Tax=Triparma strigata TaxID=1606541 RepID=A0A9W6ZZE1_9STRA|nr:hypothetical protein TrST_g7216 [Triparma strigata]